MKYSSGNSIVDRMASVNFTGNIVPAQWWHELKMPSGATDTAGVIILSEICYWYRPRLERDEATGEVKGYRKRFKADLLQRSYDSFAKQFGFTKRQVTEAIKRLENAGLIKRVFRTVNAGDMKIPNVLHIELNVDRVMDITFKSDRCDDKKRGVSHINETRPTPNSETNTETTTEITTETTTYNNMYQNEFGTPEAKKPAPQKKPKKPKQFQYPQEFEDLWALRPRRDGGNPKRQAFNAYRARLREGHTHDEMLEGMLRYVKHQEAAGNIDTPYVQQLATFFGPSLAFTEAWDIKPKKKPQSRSDRFREEAETIRKMSEWADEQIKNQGSTDWRLLK